MARSLILFAAAVVAASGQSTVPNNATFVGTTPKASAAEYPEHLEAGRINLGMEYMVHSFSEGEQMFIAERYLVVEVALFPPKGEIVNVDPMKFTLRVNGRKVALPPQNPGAVAASLSHQDWQAPRGPQADIGLGGIGIGTGRPRTQSPFPGGQDPNRLPNPPRSPNANPDVPERVFAKPEDELLRTALPAGPHRGPVAGFLYFAWQGKASSLKTVELLCDGEPVKLR